MQKITFVSRKIASEMQPRPGSILLSIHDVSEPELECSSLWSAVLFLRFHDTDGEQLGLEVFSLEHARRCSEFVAKNVDFTELVVHCQMGVSRSAAVALFLSEMLNVPCYKENLPVTAMTYRLYNRSVYSTLRTFYYGEIGDAFRELAPESSLN